MKGLRFAIVPDRRFWTPSGLPEDHPMNRYAYPNGMPKFQSDRLFMQICRDFLASIREAQASAGGGERATR